VQKKRATKPAADKICEFFEKKQGLDLRRNTFVRYQPGAIVAGLTGADNTEFVFYNKRVVLPVMSALVTPSDTLAEDLIGQFVKSAVRRGLPLVMAHPLEPNVFIKQNFACISKKNWQFARIACLARALKMTGVTIPFGVKVLDSLIPANNLIFSCRDGELTLETEYLTTVTIDELCGLIFGTKNKNIPLYLRERFSGVR
jgi:hypothetical protein